MADELTRNPADPAYRDHLLQRLRTHFDGVKPPRDEYAEVRRAYMENDARRASGQSIQPQRMMTQDEALKQQSDEYPITSALLSGAHRGADMTVQTLIGAPMMMNQAVIGQPLHVPTAAEMNAGIRGERRPMEATRAAEATHRTAGEMGLTGAALETPGQLPNMLLTMGGAGTGANLLQTGLRRGVAMMGVEGAQQASQEGYAPGSWQESAARLAAQGLGGVSSVAGTAAAAKLPGANAFKKILASGMADLASGAAAAAPVAAISDDPASALLAGGLMNLAGTVMDVPGIVGDVRTHRTMLDAQIAAEARKRGIPLTNKPLPPEVAPERLPQATYPVTDTEAATLKRLDDRAERVKQAPVTPETYALPEQAPRTADDELRDLGRMDAHSGISALGKPVASISKDIAKGITPTGKIELQRRFQSDYTKMTEKISDVLAKVPGIGHPKVLETLGLPHPNKAIRELNKFRDEQIFDIAHRGIVPLEVAGARMTPEQRLELHRRAEKMQPGWDAASSKALAEYHAAVRERADAMVRSAPRDATGAEKIKQTEGLTQRPFTQAEMQKKFSEYQKPGEQGYVMHIPDPAAGRAAKAISAGIWDARRLAGLQAKLEKPLDPHVRAKVKVDIAVIEAKLLAAERNAVPQTADDVRRALGGQRPGLERMAGTATDIFHSRMSARKKLTFDEMQEQGYVIGKDAMATTLLNEGQLMVTLKTMERAAQTPELRPFIMDIPVGADPQKPLKNWSLAKGEGWGVLRGKWLRDDVFKYLEPAVDIRKGGVWELAQASTSAMRTAGVILSPKFHVITNPIQSVLSMMQSIPIHRMPGVLFGKGGTASKMVDFFHGKDAHPYIKELMAAGKFRKMLDLADTLETSVLSHSKDFRDLEAGKSYLNQWAKRAAENAKRRASNVTESKYQGNDAATETMNKGLYGLAQTIRWGADSLSGFDILKAVGIDTTKLPEGLQAKLSVEGLGDLSAMEDDFTRLSVYSYLRDMGMTRQEAMKIDDAWFDVRKIPPIIKYATRVPLVGPTFGHWGWMYFRNLFLQRHVLVSPVKSAALLAPVYLMTKAAQLALGWSDEEVDDSMRRAGIAPNSADAMGQMMIPVGKDDAAWMDMGSVSALQAMMDLVPFLNTTRVDPGPDGAFGRAFRAQVRQSMAGSAFYKLIMRMDPRTGEHASEGSIADMMRMVPFIPAMVGSRIIGKLDRDEAAAKYGDAEAEGQSWANWFVQAFTGVRDDTGTGEYAVKREAEIEQYGAGARGYTIPGRLEEDEGRGSRRGGRSQRQRRSSR